MDAINTGWEAYLPIQATLLGGMTMRAGNAFLQLNSRKMSILLSCLLLNAGRSISVQELLEAIWPENEREDPVNALKMLIYRTRNVLKENGLPFYKECILFRNGACGWNPALPCVIDAAELEKACRQALEYPKGAAEAEPLFQRAASLYKGEFLPHCSMDDWAIRMNDYYRSLYLRTVSGLLSIYQGRKDYHAAAGLCRSALIYAPLEEELHYGLIQALANQSRSSEALSHYRHVKELFFSRLGTPPSEKLQSLWQKINDSKRHTETDLNLIKKELAEPGEPDGAFVCEYAMFRQIYWLQSRVAARGGASMHIALLTLWDTVNGHLDLASLDTAMSQLLIILQKCLRKNDVIARYSSSQYVLLLTAKTMESGRIAVKRITGAFQERYPQSPAVIHYTIQPLEPAST